MADAVSQISELAKEAEYPAQGAYVGHLLTEYLNSLLTGRLRDVELADGCLYFHVEMGQYGENLELVDTLALVVTFHRGTISLLCPSEDWWPAMEGSWIFRRLWAIAEECGCLIALASAETNAASVYDPELETALQGRVVMEAPNTIQ